MRVVGASEAAEGDPSVEPVHGGSTPEAPLADSFEDLYRSAFARMKRAAYIMTGSNETAEEVVQDAFVRLYPRFDALEDPAGYLYRSVVNGCWASHRRRRVRERSRPLPVLSEVGPPEIDETWTALRRLSPRRRAVVVLRFYADLSIADIAQALGCPSGTVKSLLHRSLAQLKDLLGQ